MTRKKRILFHSNYPASKTGLGRNCKSVLSYLYSLGKYDLCNYAQGVCWDSIDFQRYPWKTQGSLPMTQQEIDHINKDPNLARSASYGSLYIDRIIKEFKPDIYIGSDDWWAFSGYYDKSWWNKINSVFHITLDSLPILKEARDNADKVKNFFVWTEFAEKEMNKLGFDHVKTLHGAVDNSSFFRLPDSKKIELRRKNNIPDNAFIFGFVFRNQLRKEVLPLMRAFKDFEKTHPNSYLLFHTNLTEGWDINRACEDYEIDKRKILVSYICKNCKDVEIRPLGENKESEENGKKIIKQVAFGQDLNCRFCGAEKSQVSTNVLLGATEEQLNEIYNLMDGYFQLANAGGLEIPLVEALYAELNCATMNYSFGETFCAQDFIFNVDYTTSFQIGTSFERACPNEFSIVKTMSKIYDMKPEKRRENGKRGREWAISQFSPEIVGKQWEKLIDSLPEINDYDFEFEKSLKNPNYEPPDIEDDSLWLIDIYKNILNMTVDSNDEGHRFWSQKLQNGGNRKEIIDYFRSVAINDINKDKKIGLEDILNDGLTDKDRILVEMKESLGDVWMCTSLLPSLKEKYPNKKIYFCCDPKYFDILEGNPYIDGLLPWSPEMESQSLLEGAGNNKGFFDRAFILNVGTQRHLDYLFRGNSDMISYNIYDDTYNKYSI